MKEISAQELYKKIQEADFLKTCVVVDVRVPGEYQSEHIASAVNIPLPELPRRIDELRAYEKVYVHCETGGRSGEACQLIEKLSLDNWVNVHGGITAWKQAGLPVITGTHMSLFRQIMITAGFLVALGIGLSFVSLWFLIISGFVGLGLMFAGITNNCGMAIILRKMPWNNKKDFHAA